MFPVELMLNKTITYRYVIHSHRDGTPVDPSDAPFEFLSCDGVPACRCVMVEDFTAEGMLSVRRSIHDN